MKLVEALKPEENQEIESTKGLFSKKIRNIEIKNEINDVENFEEKNNRKDLIYKFVNK